MQKICPVVTRNVNNELEILLFKHPLTGIQLVKGTIEKDEEIVKAGLRELKEESGISQVKDTRYLGEWNNPYISQTWHFIHCELDIKLDDNWDFFTQDDGGHIFSFFWHPINESICDECDQMFKDAINYIKQLV